VLLSSTRLKRLGAKRCHESSFILSISEIELYPQADPRFNAPPSCPTSRDRIGTYNHIPIPDLEMDFSWTPHASFPKKLYRVCHRMQMTRWEPSKGFKASDKKTFFYRDTQTPHFVQSLLNHRRQVKWSTPYISFFENLREAENWCMAAEHINGEPARLAILDLTSDIFQEGLRSGIIRGWRLSDIVRELKITHADLVLGRGANMAESEWLFVNYVPYQAMTPGRGSVAIRNSKFYILCLRQLG
jgi:hypothetical protein